MTGTFRPLALVALMVLPAEALAFGGRHRPAAVSSGSYYYYPVLVPFVAPVVVPTYAVPAPQPAACPVPAAPAIFAVPTPAPAQEAPPPAVMPPAGVPTPGLSESRSSSYLPAARTSYYPADPATCTVTFWNRSGRDVTVRIEGHDYTLASGRGVTLDLPRQFRWQRDDRLEESEQVPVSEAGLEITIRR